jgi:hypothetical protein
MTIINQNCLINKLQLRVWVWVFAPCINRLGFLVVRHFCFRIILCSLVYTHIIRPPVLVFILVKILIIIACIIVIIMTCSHCMWLLWRISCNSCFAFWSSKIFEKISGHLTFDVFIVVFPLSQTFQILISLRFFP